MLCDHLERWDREGGRDTQEEGDMGDIYIYNIYIYIYIYMYLYICICIYIYIYIADSVCPTAEPNTPL